MLYLLGTGHFHPDTLIDNDFLESLDIGTTSRWITERVGIERRRTVLSLDYIRETKNRDLAAAAAASSHSNAEMGRRAALMAIERAGLSPKDIGLVVAGGCSPDTVIPAEAACIADLLGLSVPAFDLHSACSTFGAQLHMLEKMGDGLPEHVLTVQIEALTKVTDYADRSSAVLFGDAAAAQVISTHARSRARVVASAFGCDPSGATEVVIPRAGYFRQNGPLVQKFAIKKMSALLTEIEERLDPDRRERLIFIGHQANLVMLDSVCRRAKIPAERHLSNIVEHGNQGAAGAPVVLSQSWDRLKPGDVVALVVVGSGLSWSSVQIEIG
jgi:3-oxoacyl-[acyl-carrier-protein] synthase III